MTNRPIVFVDTETTSLGQAACPWEIAVIRRETRPGPIARPVVETTVDRWVLQVEYDFPTLPPGTTGRALSVGGWLERGAPGSTYLDGLNRDGVNVERSDEVDVAARLVELFRDEPILVGVGVHFDAAVLSRMFARHGMAEEPWHYSIVDLKSATWGFFRGRAVDIASPVLDEQAPLPVRSEKLAAALCVAPPSDAERHTALGDARWAVRWFDALTAGSAA